MRRTAVLMITAAVLANLAFTWLGSVFDYPDVLGRPVEEILAGFTAHEQAVIAGFLALALGAGLLAPVAVGVGRLSDARAMRWAVPVGIAAAAVQVVGLLRWPLLVPRWAMESSAGSAAARESFATAHRLLGTALGETGGYLLTALWTGLVLVALGARFGRWFTALGAASAALVLVGVLGPLDLPLVDLANFVGYVLWSVWLVAFGVVVLVRKPAAVTR
jgi:hypothetical protein